MDKIKKYKQFNEDIKDTSGSLYNDYDAIYEIFESAIIYPDKSSGNNSYTSYSTIVRRYKENEHFEDNIYNILISEGLTEDDIKNNIQKLAVDFNDYSGEIDLFFYTYLKKWNLPYRIKKKMDGLVEEKEYPLSGALITDCDTDELYIKYRYGYHNCYYGKLMIEQSFGNNKNFFNELAKELSKEIYLDGRDFFWEREIVNNQLSSSNILVSIKLAEEIKKNFIVNKNTIELDWYKLYNELESVVPTKFDNEKEFYNSFKMHLIHSYGATIKDINGRKIKIIFGNED